MTQSRSDMADILRKLHDIQLAALNLGVHAFYVETHTYSLDDEGGGNEALIREYGDTEERFITIYSFLRGDNSDEDYGHWDLGQFQSDLEIEDILTDIRKFICRV